MREVFLFLFKLRGMKFEKLKVSINDMITISRTYNHFRLKRFIIYKDYYLRTLQYSVDNLHSIDDSSIEVAQIILEEKMIK